MHFLRLKYSQIQKKRSSFSTLCLLFLRLFLVPSARYRIIINGLGRCSNDGLLAFVTLKGFTMNAKKYPYATSGLTTLVQTFVGFSCKIILIFNKSSEFYIMNNYLHTNKRNLEKDLLFVLSYIKRFTYHSKGKNKRKHFDLYYFPIHVL